MNYGRRTEPAPPDERHGVPFRLNPGLAGARVASAAGGYIIESARQGVPQMLRLLIAALVIRFVWWLITRQMRGSAEPRPRARSRSVALVRDPVCGTFVEPARALEVRVGSTVHYFCSERCRSQFRSRS